MTLTWLAQKTAAFPRLRARSKACLGRRSECTGRDVQILEDHISRDIASPNYRHVHFAGFTRLDSQTSYLVGSCIVFDGYILLSHTV